MMNGPEKSDPAIVCAGQRPDAIAGPRRSSRAPDLPTITAPAAAPARERGKLD
jgi:hypothetical protein